jgi:hypothetical protein
MVTMKIPSQEEIRALHKQYFGKRIKVFSMVEEPNPVPYGTEGSCWGVDSLGQLLVKWDNGSMLNLLPGVDEFEIVG